jgi:hypothetical protein
MDSAPKACSANGPSSTTTHQVSRFLLIQAVSGVAEEVCAFVRFELLQGIGGGSLESVEGSRRSSVRHAVLVETKRDSWQYA